jgi:hypothetical protein
MFRRGNEPIFEIAHEGARGRKERRKKRSKKEIKKNRKKEREKRKEGKASSFQILAIKSPPQTSTSLLHAPQPCCNSDRPHADLQDAPHTIELTLGRTEGVGGTVIAVKSEICTLLTAACNAKRSNSHAPFRIELEPNPGQHTVKQHDLPPSRTGTPVLYTQHPTEIGRYLLCRILASSASLYNTDQAIPPSNSPSARG